MTQQPQQTPPQPNQTTVITIQKRMIDELNDNRVFLISSLEDMRNEAQAEIGRLMGIISGMKGETAVAEAATTEDPPV